MDKYILNQQISYSDFKLERERERKVNKKIHDLFFTTTQMYECKLYFYACIWLRN